MDRVVGIQDDMEVKPEGSTVQEGQDGFDHYKPAAKVRSSVLPFSSISGAVKRMLLSLF